MMMPTMKRIKKTLTRHNHTFFLYLNINKYTCTDSFMPPPTHAHFLYPKHKCKFTCTDYPMPQHPLIHLPSHYTPPYLELSFSSSLSTLSLSLRSVTTVTTVYYDDRRFDLLSPSRQWAGLLSVEESDR
jgi:hypothetical protein